MNQENFRKLISGQKAGLSAGLLRLLLSIGSAGYSIAVRLRNFLYSKGWLKAHRADAVVISIGNITVGGTGKTPLVAWLCKFLQRKKIQCAILTRGYKARGTRDEGRETKIDEPAILAESCPEAKVIVNPDRVGGADEAVSNFKAKVLIMDDGFQHRRLVRDLDIVVIDATRPFGYGKMLPAGLLREPVSSLKRADGVVITRCDQITENELCELEKKLRTINSDMIIARSIHNPAYVKYSKPPIIPAKQVFDSERGARIQKNNETLDSCFRRNDSIEQLKGKKIFAFCGIGNPEAFLNTIKQLGAHLVGSKVYNDHHHYTNNCLTDIYEQARALKADLILTTQKDWTKIISDFRAKISNFESSPPFAYIGIEIKFISGEDKLRGLIENTLACKILRK